MSPPYHFLERIIGILATVLILETVGLTLVTLLFSLKSTWGDHALQQNEDVYNILSLSHKVNVITIGRVMIV